MCLMKGREKVSCSHPTCLRAFQNPDFFKHTKKYVFEHRGDFSKVKVCRNAEGAPDIIIPLNPHKTNASTWLSFRDFIKTCTLKAAGNWPRNTIIDKRKIDIQYFLYNRRIQSSYNALKDEYDYSLVIDVDEVAVYLATE